MPLWLAAASAFIRDEGIELVEAGGAVLRAVRAIVSSCCCAIRLSCGCVRLWNSHSQLRMPWVLFLAPPYVLQGKVLGS